MQYTSVTSKFKPIMLFLVVFMVIVLFFLFIVLQTEPEIFIFSLLFIMFVLYGLIKIVSNLIPFKIDTQKIRYGWFKTYPLSDINEMTLYDYATTKMFFIPFPEQAVTLVFDDGQKVSFKDNYYTNLWKLRFFLERKIIEKESIPTFNYKTKFNDVVIENKTSSIPIYIKVLPYVALLSLISFITLISYAIIKGDFKTDYIMLNFAFLFLYLIMFGMGTYYIESSKSYIVVKSLGFLFYKKAIPINQITHIEKRIVGGGRSSRTILSIHTVYHKVFRFSIDFISMKREDNMINQFKKLGIKYYDYT